MSNRNYSKEELDAALASMGVTDQINVSRYGSGHINDTFKVETASGARYILQRVNTDIFPPDILKANVVRVTEFLKAKGIKSLEVVGYENPWRLYAFLEGYKSIDLVTNPAEAELAAGAFAKFQNDLADLPAPRLGDIIPKFHNTVDRLRQLDEAAQKDVKGRKALVAEELAFIDARREEAAKIVTMMEKGEIPERITHNDTKINNVMLAEDGTNVVIDLDTTMPGSALYDFGDLVRTSTAAAAEDEKDLEKVYSKKEYFEALVKGYLAGAKFLTDTEKSLLAVSGRLITLTIGIRFLTDYLAGDT
jgi:Ser/Thr protein kinase RdoA (MazF antagonist)